MTRQAGSARRRPAARPAWLGVVLTLAATGGGAPSCADAGHGGVVQLRAAPAGPYAISVWTQPAPPRPGPWRVDVAVMREGGAPVPDAVVRVRAEPLGDLAAAAEAEARRDADPLGLRHRAELVLGAAGPWQVTVAVTGPGGAGTLTFPVDVEPAGRRWWLGSGIVLGALAVVAALVARRRRPGGARPANRARASERPR